MDIDLLDLGDDYQPAVIEEKCTIFVTFEGKENQVSWYRGMPSKDIEDAILCACDSIADQGFTLNDSAGFPVDFGEVVPGERYMIQLGNEIKGKEKIIGDRMRRLTVEIEPLQHQESTKAFEIMKIGSNLLKHTQSSLPHIRLFQLTEDLKHIMWYSGAKTQEKSSVLTSTFQDIYIGQKSEAFQNYPIPSLTHLSFSVVHSKGTLNLTCRDEREFDFWVLGFKALMYHFHGLNISKQELLSHSRRFTEYLQTNKLSQATSIIYKEPEAKNLEECILRKRLSPSDISLKLVKVHNKLTMLAEKILDLPNDTYAYEGNKESSVVNGNEYSEVFEQDVGFEEIYHTEQQRLSDLSVDCRVKLVKLESEFANEIGKNGGKDTTEFEVELWRLEVDVENLSDIVIRIERASQGKIGSRLKSWFKELF